VLDFNATVVASVVVNLAAARTNTASTHNTAVYDEDTTLAPGVNINQGVVNIEANNSAVFCSGMEVDAASAVPVGIALHMVRVNAHPGTVE
jgi:hypothetical protein